MDVFNVAQRISAAKTVVRHVGVCASGSEDDCDARVGRGVTHDVASAQAVQGVIAFIATEHVGLRVACQRVVVT